MPEALPRRYLKIMGGSGRGEVPPEEEDILAQFETDNNDNPPAEGNINLDNLTRWNGAIVVPDERVLEEFGFEFEPAPVIPEEFVPFFLVPSFIGEDDDDDLYDDESLFQFPADWAEILREPDSVQGGEDEAEVEESATVKFNPPVYLQRYCRVFDHLKALMESPKYRDVCVDTGKTVMEVGCAEFGMMRYFKNALDIGKLIFLDLDRDLMLEKAHLLKPLPAEYLQKPQRPQPLKVEAYSGCITKVDAKLHQETSRDLFAIVGIEIIEHLYPGVLLGFEQTVFGIYSPQIVIVTTPNSDFNQVFNLPPGKFRHWDHKFEWSRQEFENWCKKIVTEYPKYTYAIEGICKGPEETLHLGCVSQMAIFEKREVAVGLEKEVASELAFRIEDGAYSIVESLEFPNYVEKRTTEQIARDEFRYYLNNFLFTPNALDDFHYEEVKSLKIPLAKFQNLPGMPQAVKDDVSILRIIIENEGHEIIEEEEEMKVQFDVEALALAMQKERDELEDVEVDDDFYEELPAERTTEESASYLEEESWE